MITKYHTRATFDDLEIKFCEELDYTYQIEIAGVKYFGSEIMKECDGHHYTEELYNYINGLLQDGAITQDSQGNYYWIDDLTDYTTNKDRI